MRAIPLVALALVVSLAGCTTGDDNVVYSATGPLEDIHESGGINAGRAYTVFEFEVQETVLASAEFVPSEDIEYASINFQDCDVGGGSGTGYDRDGGPYGHSDRFQPGNGCITIETRHTLPFQYTLNVVFEPVDAT